MIYISSVIQMSPCFRSSSSPPCLSHPHKKSKIESNRIEWDRNHTPGGDRAVHEEEVDRAGGGRGGPAGDVEGVRGGGGVPARGPPAAGAAAQGEGREHPPGELLYIARRARVLYCVCSCISAFIFDFLFVFCLNAGGVVFHPVEQMMPRGTVVVDGLHTPPPPLLQVVCTCQNLHL